MIDEESDPYFHFLERRDGSPCREDCPPLTDAAEFKEVDEIWHAGDVGDVSVIDELRDFKPLAVHAVIGNFVDTNRLVSASADMQRHFGKGHAPHA